MKKLFTILTIAALAVTAFTACKKDPKPADDNQPAAETNLWKAVEANYTIEWFYNPDWKHGDGITDPALQPKVTLDKGEWTVVVPDLTTGDWQAQLWIFPKEALRLDKEKKYKFSLEVESSTEGQFYLKLYHKGIDGEFCCHLDPRPMLNAGQIQVFVFEDITVLDNDLQLLIDFGGHAANTTFKMRDIKLEEMK